MHALPALLVLVLSQPGDYHRILVVDEATGRGVPLVELTTTNDITHITDSAGVVAFFEPGLMDQEVYFGVKSHGYEFPKDGFGLRGRKVRTAPGGKTVLKIQRLNIAERLYRVTGGGIYRDSVLLGETPPVAQPLLNGRVLGQDSVNTVVYRGKLWWFWGDTNWPAYPLGEFHTPGATSKLPADGLDPNVGINLTYFTGENGFVRSMCHMAGSGPTWVDGVTVVPDADGRERMLTHYVKIKPPLSVYESGLAEYDDAQERFVHHSTYPEGAAVHPLGHTLRVQESGQDHVYYTRPYPLVRVPATAEAVRDLARYETWTYYPAGNPTAVEPERDAQGKLVLGWKKSARPLDQKAEARLVKNDRLRPEERFFVMADARSGKAVQPHTGTVAWNAYRQKYVMLFGELMGASVLGEIWYAESDSLTGPWDRAVKVATHEKYDFYNPKHHAMLDQDGGRVIYFEGTYTNTFSGNPERTPRYNYNQVLYKLDLSDERLR